MMATIFSGLSVFAANTIYNSARFTATFDHTTSGVTTVKAGNQLTVTVDLAVYNSTDVLSNNAVVANGGLGIEYDKSNFTLIKSSPAVETQNYTKLNGVGGDASAYTDDLTVDSTDASYGTIGDGTNKMSRTTIYYSDMTAPILNLHSGSFVSFTFEVSANATAGNYNFRFSGSKYSTTAGATFGKPITNGKVTATTGNTITQTQFNTNNTSTKTTVGAISYSDATVTIEPSYVASSVKTISGFTLSGVAGTINDTNSTIAVTVPYETDLTNLTPTVSLTDSKSSVSPLSGVAQDFSTAKHYIVTAEDHSTKDYTVTVSKSAKLTPTFSLAITQATKAFDLTINNTSAGSLYQVWVQEQYAAGGTYWRLVQAYGALSAGSAHVTWTGSADSILKDNFSITVRVKGGGDVDEYTTTYSAKAANLLRINNIKVDGKVPSSAVFKAVGSHAVFAVSADMGGDSTGIMYDYYLNGVLFAQNAGANFDWTIPAGQKAGTFTVKVIAYKASGETDSAAVNLSIFNLAQKSPWLAAANPITITGVLNAGQSFTVHLNDDAVQNSGVSNIVHKMQIGEAYAPATTIFTNSLPVTLGSGIYEIIAGVKDSNSATNTDNATTQIKVKRSGSPIYFSGIAVTKKGSPLAEAGYSSLAKGDALTFTASSNGTKYSFWRLDKSGWNIIRAWDSSNVCPWTPAQNGNYTIEVRVKADDSGSYEDVKDFNFVVGKPAIDTAWPAGKLGISLVTNPDKTVTLSATGVSLDSNPTTEYKFAYTRGTWYQPITGYSLSNTTTWMPNRLTPGTQYTVTLYVKDVTSDGFYDAMTTATYTVPGVS